MLFQGENEMKAIEVVGTIEENRRVRLDEPLPPAFDFLNAAD